MFVLHNAGRSTSRLRHVERSPASQVTSPPGEIVSVVLCRAAQEPRLRVGFREPSDAFVLADAPTVPSPGTTTCWRRSAALCSRAEVRNTLPFGTPSPSPPSSTAAALIGGRLSDRQAEGRSLLFPLRSYGLALPGRHRQQLQRFRWHGDQRVRFRLPGRRPCALLSMLPNPGTAAKRSGVFNTAGALPIFDCASARACHPAITGGAIAQVQVEIERRLPVRQRAGVRRSTILGIKAVAVAAILSQRDLPRCMSWFLRRASGLLGCAPPEQ